MECPICGAPYGFHDDEPHWAIAHPKIVVVDPSERPTVKMCNCGEPYGEPGAPQCRNPNHED